MLTATLLVHQEWNLRSLAGLRTLSFSIDFDPKRYNPREITTVILEHFPRNSCLRSITLLFTFESWIPRDTHWGWYESVDYLCGMLSALETVRLIWVDVPRTQGLYTQNATDGTPVRRTRWSEDHKVLIRRKMRGLDSRGILKFQ